MREKNSDTVGTFSYVKRAPKGIFRLLGLLSSHHEGLNIHQIATLTHGKIYGGSHLFNASLLVATQRQTHRAKKFLRLNSKFFRVAFSRREKKWQLITILNQESMAKDRTAILFERELFGICHTERESESVPHEIQRLTRHAFSGRYCSGNHRFHAETQSS
jgi:hypothetical protein